MALMPLTPKPGTAPTGGNRATPGGWRGRLEGLTARRLKDFLISRATFWLRRKRWPYPRPRALFALPNGMVRTYCARTGFELERVVPIHTMEYDRYLQYRRRHPQGEPPEGTCVFLDEALTHHPDYALVHGKAERGVEQEYFEKMTALFERIEAQTGLEVVVAAHPRSRYEELGQTFGGRRVVRGRTQELVARSGLVLAHASTAISFAALFEKPLLFLWAQGAWPRTRYLPEYLNTELLDLEAPGALEAFDFSQFMERPLDYGEYVSQFLKSDQAPADKTCWELIGPRLENLP